MTEEALGKGAVKPLNNTLISRNFSGPTANIGFEVSYFSGHTSHKLATSSIFSQVKGLHL